MSVVGDYWAGVLQRLQVEVDVFSRLIGHAPEQGRENELALARVLANLVPQRFGIGTGVLLDTQNERSAQTDIVIYSQTDQPSLFAQTTQLLFPVEVVFVCVEVKTTLRHGDIDDCKDKAKRLRRLQPSPFDGNALHPIFVVFAYDMDMSPAAMQTRFLSEGPDPAPDILCVLQPGVIGGAAGAVPALADRAQSWSAGLVLLEELGEHGDMQPVVPQPDRPGQPRTHASHAGRLYPKTRLGNETVLGDPARALLLLMEALLLALHSRAGIGQTILSAYLTDEARSIEAIGI